MSDQERGAWNVVSTIEIVNHDGDHPSRFCVKDCYGMVLDIWYVSKPHARYVINLIEAYRAVLKT
jgi:hypothetical protein